LSLIYHHLKITMKKILLLIGVLLASTTTFAAGVPASFTYQGIVMNSAGTAPLTSVVSLKLSIYDPTGTCLLYQEQQANIDLSQTNGTFAVQVGSAVGAAKRTGTDQGLAMTSVFANNGQILAASTTNCTTGYTPAANDNRLLRVAVTNGGSTVTISPDLQINAVPNALVAETLQGQTPSQIFHAPIVSVLTSGTSQTYTTPAGTHFLKIKMVGGGGGGSGTNNGGTAGTLGGNGASSTFGSSLLVAGGGTGSPYGNGGGGGSGGTASIGSGASGVALTGAEGAVGGGNVVMSNGGSGGNTTFGGAGSGGIASGGGGLINGQAAATNTGSGGGGSSGNPGQAAPGGGGAGGYVEAIISNPSGTYSYSVGAGGIAGTAGTSGNVGGAGSAGLIIVEAY
jgi:hypothetical protein